LKYLHKVSQLHYFIQNYINIGLQQALPVSCSRAVQVKAKHRTFHYIRRITSKR